MVALVVSLGVAIVAFASGGATQVCVPTASNKALVTPKGGVCKAGYTLKEVGVEGKEGPPGKEGPAGQARAYARITPGAPATIQPGSRGVLEAKTFFGQTCVVLDPSIDLSTVTPVVTADFNPVLFNAHPKGCSFNSKTGIEVTGRNPNQTENSTETFSIVVP
jgi:hypothetical protein